MVRLLQRQPARPGRGVDGGFLGRGRRLPSGGRRDSLRPDRRRWEEESCSFPGTVPTHVIFPVPIAPETPGRPLRENFPFRRDRSSSTERARAGFRLFIFSGGEALLRSDLPELVRYTASRGMRPVLGSNGTLLDEPLARTLQRAGLARAGSASTAFTRKRTISSGVSMAPGTPPWRPVAGVPPSAFPFRYT